MLESLTLRRFQCHDKRTIEFDRITTFVGPTDSGKSSALRCLRWICTNRPTGDAFIQHGEDSCLGTLAVDGRKIVRKRGKGVNTYSLDGKKFKAFGQDVPPEIAALLGVSELNFQGQLDAPFWFALPAPQVSRELNSVVNLDVIDRTLGNVAAEVRRAKAAVEVTEQRLRDAETAVQQYENLDLVDQQLSEIERLEEGIASRASVRASAALLLAEGERIEKELDRSSAFDVEAFRDAVTEIDAIDARIQEREAKCSILQQLLADAEAAEDAIKRTDRERVKLERELRTFKQCPVCGGKMS